MKLRWIIPFAILAVGCASGDHLSRLQVDNQMSVPVRVVINDIDTTALVPAKTVTLLPEGHYIDGGSQRFLIKDEQGHELKKINLNSDQVAASRSFAWFNDTFTLVVPG